jgi:hypothetical protein
MTGIEKNVRQAVEAAIRSHFKGTDIISIAMKRVESFDGGNLLKVTVVYQTRSGLIDPKKAAGIAGRIKPTLEENEFDAFPVFSFISKADSGRISARN